MSVYIMPTYVTDLVVGVCAMVDLNIACLGQL